MDRRFADRKPTAFLRAGVIGAGKSGLAAAALLRQLGAYVLLSEKGKLPTGLPRGVETESGGHSSRLLTCDLLVRSPGVPNHLPVLRAASRRGIPLWSEIELGSLLLPDTPLIGITGTNGKTTTTTLVGEIFRQARRLAFVGGNLGTPLADFVRQTPVPPLDRTVVLEVSSYQLEDTHRFHPQVSAILNITPDHLEHHGTMARYAAAKAKIFQNQTARDVAVFNADDAWCRRLATRCRARPFWFSRTRPLTRGIFFEPTTKSVIVRWGRFRARWGYDSRLPGPHNIENVLAAVAIALAGGVPLPVIRRAVRRFRGVEHRLEFVRRVAGVDYVNDSKGTNVDSTRVALASFDRPVVLIAGGQGKGSPYTPLRPLVKSRVQQLLLIGEDAGRIRKELGDLVPTSTPGTIAKAVPLARRLAPTGAVVLLSPACASFDQFQNYEHRGRVFKDCVRRLS